jgi:hypothetical protein
MSQLSLCSIVLSSPMPIPWPESPTKCLRMRNFRMNYELEQASITVIRRVEGFAKQLTVK